MKKKWKIFWIVCGVFAVVGVGFCVTGVALGANVPQAFAMISREDKIEDCYDETFHNEDCYDETFYNIESLNLDVKLSDVYFVEGNEGEVRVTVDYSNPDSSKVYVTQDANKLTIESKGDKKWWYKNYTEDRRVITVYVPSKLMDVALDIQMGYLSCDAINASEISIDVDAAQAIISSMRARKAKIELAAGSVEAYGNIGETTEIDCDAGEVVFHATGAKEDYDYDVDCKTGNVEIEGENYHKDHIEHHKEAHKGQDCEGKHCGRKMNVECEAGTVSVFFNN